jgi:hypothetical protein
VLFASTLVIASCGATSERPVYIDDEVRSPTTTAVLVPLTTLAPAPLATAQTESVIEQLSSPKNAIAEIMGSGASIDEVALKIEDAKVAAAERFNSATMFPSWTIATAGPFSGTGGTTDAETKTITVYSNRNRTVADFARTILHEWGHVFDAERLTDDGRAEYLALRGIAADTEWTADDDHSIGAWALQPSEDFAEVIALIVSDGDYTPRTETLAPVPTDVQLAAIASLVDL